MSFLFKDGDRVLTPDGAGELWEVSENLGYCSVFLDKDNSEITKMFPDQFKPQRRLRPRFYKFDQIQKEI